jgi:hypothetical protein
MDDVEGMSEASDSYAGAVSLCELNLEIVYEAGEREIEHVWKLDCDFLPCRGCCKTCMIVPCGRRTAK